MVYNKIYFITLENNQIIFTNNKKELIDKINQVYQDNPLFRPYDTNKLNNIIFKKNIKQKEIKDIQIYNMNEYYQPFVDKYLETIKQKTIKHNNIIKHYQPAVIEKKLKLFVNTLYQKENILRKSGIQDKQQIIQLLSQDYL